MNTAWFEDFLVLAATQNFSRAAQERHVTQPAFGRRIRSLEEWLGVSLFDRSTQPVQLTTAGKWFESVARATLQRISHLPREAQDVVASQSATLKLAATHALSFTFVPTWLRRVESHLALGPIQLVSDVLPRCDHLLDQREVHFAISHAIANAVHDGKDIQTQYLTIGSDALIAVSGVNTRGQVIYSLEAKQDADVPLLAYSEDSGLGQILHASLSHRLSHARLKPVMTAHLASVLRNMALAGRGVAWLPLSLIAQDLEVARLKRCAPIAWDIPLDVRLKRRSSPLGEAAEAFWQLIQSNKLKTEPKKKPPRHQ
jgi:LysR family transcriptional regulator, hypochlorite-specific transcription factor HypT